MSKNVANQLVCKYGFGRMVNCRRVNGLADTRILNTNYHHLIWGGQSTSFLVNYRDFSTRQPLSSATSSVLPKINALLNDTKRFTPVSTNIISGGKSLFRRQWDAFFNWYDEISHTNEVREAHKQVEELQDKLSQAQNLRRDVSKELSDIRYELQTCYADQANCPKGDPRFLELIRREIEISNKEKQKNEEFSLLDKAERDLFILMQSAVKTSHEKEKIHTNSAKYWSIVGSLAGALLGICGTAFSFYNRNDLLSDINKEFVVIRADTKSISEQVQLLVNEQREFLQGQQQRDREQLENEARTNVAASKSQQAISQSSESWIHWIARTTYVISIYRYFVPKTVE
ncbi:mitochondrial potassium channel-like [Sitodiplosis mosellana]|uniref:mitochondrial potassium channel-like n=1 Tax=Sitodiplosis mosellana TaxID=263140 RepID=UPI0024445AA4|nr:mitochondrial potassium channel-like [Sitodiplosis mosellana]